VSPYQDTFSPFGYWRVFVSLLYARDIRSPKQWFESPVIGLVGSNTPPIHSLYSLEGLFWKILYLLHVYQPQLSNILGLSYYRTSQSISTNRATWEKPGM
jgi:hypothetical protein